MTFTVFVFCCSTILFMCIIFGLYYFFSSPILNRNVSCSLLCSFDLIVSCLICQYLSSSSESAVSVSSPFQSTLQSPHYMGDKFVCVSPSKSESPCESRTPWHEIGRIFLEFQYALKQKN